MDNNARTPPKFRCIKCGTIWKQHADKSWSLFDQYQKPEQCCDNSTDFLSVLEPYDKVSQGLDGFLALEHPLRELSNAITPITEGLYCKVCERDYYVPDDLEDTGICDRCAQTEVTRLQTELAAANERAYEWSAKGAAAESKLEAANEREKHWREVHAEAGVAMIAYIPIFGHLIDAIRMLGNRALAAEAAHETRYDEIAEYVTQVANAAQEAFRQAGIEPGEWDSDNIVLDVSRGIANDIARLREAARAEQIERDAKICDDYAVEHNMAWIQPRQSIQVCANRIRAQMDTTHKD